MDARRAFELGGGGLRQREAAQGGSDQNRREKARTQEAEAADPYIVPRQESPPLSVSLGAMVPRLPHTLL